MKTSEVVTLGAVVLTLMTSPAASAEKCPPEIGEAKAKITSLKKTQAEVRAPRTAAGARTYEASAPRGQEQQNPRGQEQQNPRGQEQQNPRGQEQQNPRGQEVQAPRTAVGARDQAPEDTRAKIAGAQKLVAEAEQKCKQAQSSMAASAEKARAALDALK